MSGTQCRSPCATDGKGVRVPEMAFELTRLRREAGLDQKDVAKALRCTVGKVSYYETAERPVVVRDLDEVLLPLYRVPEDRWPVYLQAAKDSRQKGW